MNIYIYINIYYKLLYFVNENLPIYVIEQIVVLTLYIFAVRLYDLI